MFRSSNTQGQSNDLSSSPSGSSFVTILSGGADAPDVDAGIVALVSSLVGREVRFSEHSEQANEIRRVILHYMGDLLRLLDYEGTFPPGSDDHSETANRRIQSIPIGRITAKGWINKLDRAWTRNSAISSHLLRFEELYPNWDSQDNYKLARVSDMVFDDLFEVLHDLKQIFMEYPDTSDEEDFKVEDVDPLNPFLSDDEFGLSDSDPVGDSESESGDEFGLSDREPESSDEQGENMDGVVIHQNLFDDPVHQVEIPDLEISQLHINDSDSS